MMFAMSNPVEYSIEHLADVSKDIPNMVVQLSFLVMSGIYIEHREIHICISLLLSGVMWLLLMGRKN